MQNTSTHSIHIIILHWQKPAFISSTSRSYIHYPDIDKKLKVRTKIDQNVVVLKLFPGITQPIVHAILNIPGLKAVVLESFGAGNAPRHNWFFSGIKRCYRKGHYYYQ